MNPPDDLPAPEGERGEALRPVLVVDYGAQYAQLIARRIREAHVYSEIVPHTMSVADMLAKDPAAIVLSGGPASVYAPGAPSLDPALCRAGVPVLGICYGFQAMALALGGTVERTGRSEYGRTEANTAPGTESVLFAGQPASQQVWMSHGDSVAAAPDGFTVTASSPNALVAAFEAPQDRLFGVQWHPEVLHTTYGQAVLEHFLYDGAGLEPSWTTTNIIDDTVVAVRAQVGTKHVLCG
ncbi:MAG TPA: glutamine-hydrolyzing GMP synthase, partial [Acidimicrobiales bacterium]